MDHVYMSALHLLGEQGGWPLTMFLTPAGEPFWGGTYFPKEPRFGRPGFVAGLQEVARIFHAEPERIAHNQSLIAQDASRHGGAQATAGRSEPGRSRPDRRAARSIFSIPGMAACKGAPKFPNPPILEFLLSLRPPQRRSDGARARLLIAWNAWRSAAFTTISAAASPAIPSTSAGSCRISRRCSTTTRSFSSSMRSPRGDRADAVPLRRRGHRRLARAGDGHCRRAPSPRASMPIRKARRGGSMSGACDEIREVLGEEADVFARDLRHHRRRGIGKAATSSTASARARSPPEWRRVSIPAAGESSSTAGRAASGRASTTRFWPTGTG